MPPSTNTHTHHYTRRKKGLEKLWSRVKKLYHRDGAFHGKPDRSVLLSCLHVLKSHRTSNISTRTTKSWNGNRRLRGIVPEHRCDHLSAGRARPWSMPYSRSGLFDSWLQWESLRPIMGRHFPYFYTARPTPRTDREREEISWVKSKYSYDVIRGDADG